MFTGIVEEKGIIGSIRKSGKAVLLEINAGIVLGGMRRGDSVAVNGVCLTVSELHQNGFTIDVMPETVRRTALHTLRAGSKVNLERALRLSDRIGGHLVSGHIDGAGKILERRREENSEWYRIGGTEMIMRYIVAKGSVAVDGISLTVAAVDTRSFTVSVIPVTQAETTILDKQTGDEVNIECDIIGKYIEKMLKGETKGQGVTLDLLARNGFI